MIVMSINLYFLYQEIKLDMTSKLKNHVDIKVNVLTRNIIPYMSSYSVDEYTKLIKSHIANKDFLAILVKDFNMGEVISSSHYLSGYILVDKKIEEFNQNNNYHKSIIDNSYYSKEYSINDGKKVIGKIEIFVSDDVINERLNDMFLNIISKSIFLSSILIFISLFIIMYIFFLKPINSIIEFIKDTDSEGIPKKIVDITSTKEIDFLIQSINKTLSLIEDSNYKLKVNMKQTTLNKLKYKALLDLASDSIFVLDENGQLLEFSYNTKNVLGYTIEEMSNLTIFDWNKNITSSQYANFVNILSTKPRMFETIHTRKDGTTYDAQISATKIYIKDKVYVYTSVRDITKTKKLQIDLIKAKDIAEKANESKSQFLANMSHEVRTPLNGIIGLTQLTLETKLNKEQESYLNKSKQSSLALLNVINDILDYSKIEAGKLDIINSEFRLEEILKNVSGLFEYKMYQKDLDFIFDIDERLSVILVGDSLRITQVLNNLIGNSIKFTHEGSVSLKIDILEMKKDRVKIRFCIKDSGIGISEEKKVKLFQAFEQGDSSTTKEYGGTGLGLMISKQLVELMGGNIGFSSKENIGSEFYFVLDLEYREVDEEYIEEVEKDRVEVIRLKDTKLVLIVEDNTTNQLVASKMLEKIGFEVDIASNGQEAVQMSQSKEYDIIFMDLQMPVMDGFEATIEIRKFDKEIPIVALSAAVMRKDKEETKEVGMNDHICKPINKEELYRVVADYFVVENIIEDRVTNSDLIKIDGIDIDKLYESMANSQSQTYDLLKDFKDSYAAKIEDIANLDMNNKESRDFIHKLKGVSGNLTIYKIHNLCNQIEKESTNKLLVDKLKSELENIIDLLDKSLPQVEQENLISEEEFEQIFEKLIDDIDNFRLISSKVLDNIENYFNSKLNNDKISDIKVFYKQHDFDDMKNILISLKDSINE
jgi:PAS domain S-box-containing protein